MKQFFNKFKNETEDERIQREKEEQLLKEKQARNQKIGLIILGSLLIIGFPTLYFLDKNDTTSKKIPTESVERTTIDSSKSTTKETSSMQSTTETSIVLEEPILNKENNTDLAHILNDSNDIDSYKKFVEKYKGQKIEFDGNIANMQKYGNKKTRYNFLVYSGNYSETTSTGVGFHIQNKNVTYDLHLTGDNIPDSISEGQNINIIAEVVGYADNDLIIIDPVETRIRD